VPYWYLGDDVGVEAPGRLVDAREHHGHASDARHLLRANFFSEVYSRMINNGLFLFTLRCIASAELMRENTTGTPPMPGTYGLVFEAHRLLYHSA